MKIVTSSKKVYYAGEIYTRYTFNDYSFGWFMQIDGYETKADNEESLEKEYQELIKKL